MTRHPRVRVERIRSNMNELSFEPRTPDGCTEPAPGTDHARRSVTSLQNRSTVGFATDRQPEELRRGAGGKQCR